MLFCIALDSSPAVLKRIWQCFPIIFFRKFIYQIAVHIKIKYGCDTEMREWIFGYFCAIEVYQCQCSYVGVLIGHCGRLYRSEIDFWKYKAPLFFRGKLYNANCFTLGVQRSKTLTKIGNRSMLMPLLLHVDVIVPVRTFPLRGMSVYEFHGVALRIQS